jgi:hypothetical protein
MIDEMIKEIESITRCDLSNVNRKILFRIAAEEDLTNFKYCKQDFFDNIEKIHDFVDTDRIQIIKYVYTNLKSSTRMVLGMSLWEFIDSLPDPKGQGIVVEEYLAKMAKKLDVYKEYTNN